MMIRKIKKTLSQRRGMTLVEVIAAFAIFSLCAVLMTSSIAASLNLIKRSIDITQNGDAAFSQIEEYSAGGSGETVTFSAGGKTYSVNGEFSDFSQGTNPKVSFSQFTPTEKEAGS